jgi:hypothetical protein
MLQYSLIKFIRMLPCFNVEVNLFYYVLRFIGFYDLLSSSYLNFVSYIFQHTFF